MPWKKRWQKSMFKNTRMGWIPSKITEWAKFSNMFEPSLEFIDYFDVPYKCMALNKHVGSTFLLKLINVCFFFSYKYNTCCYIKIRVVDLNKYNYREVIPLIWYWRVVSQKNKNVYQPHLIVLIIQIYLWSDVL